MNRWHILMWSHCDQVFSNHISQNLKKENRLNIETKVALNLKYDAIFKELTDEVSGLIIGW